MSRPSLCFSSNFAGCPWGTKDEFCFGSCIGIRAGGFLQLSKGLLVCSFGCHSIGAFCDGQGPGQAFGARERGNPTVAPCNYGKVKTRGPTSLHHLLLSEQSRSKGDHGESTHRQELRICRLVGNIHNPQIAPPQWGGSSQPLNTWSREKPQ